MTSLRPERTRSRSATAATSSSSMTTRRTWSRSRPRSRRSAASSCSRTPGVEALARLLEQDFALIILDVAMPGMDGFETARLVRSRDTQPRDADHLRHRPVVAGRRVLRGYELGAFDFLMKPIRPEVLRAKASVFVAAAGAHARAASTRPRSCARRRRARTSASCSTQRKRFEAEVLERQMAQMAETDRRKDEFLAILAHELRNPLQPLQTAVEVLEHDPDAPVPARVRGIIQRQVHHITRLVDDLLDVARFHDRQARAAPRAGRRSTTIVDEAVETSRRGAIDARKHTVDGRSAASTPPIVYGDPIRLVQVIVQSARRTRRSTPSPAARSTSRWGIARRATRSSASPTTAAASRRAVAARSSTCSCRSARRPTAPAGSASASVSSSASSSCTAARVHASSDGHGQGSTFEVRDRRSPTPRRSRSTSPPRTKTGPAGAAAARGRRATTPPICASSSPICCG